MKTLSKPCNLGRESKNGNSNKIEENNTNMEDFLTLIEGKFVNEEGVREVGFTTQIYEGEGSVQIRKNH